MVELSLSQLPQPLTALVGREHELASVIGLLQRSEVRLLSLLGSPGIGKTRLAIAVAQRLESTFVDGIAFVDLAPLTDARMVVPTIVRTLGLQAGSSQDLVAALSHFLANKRLLLVLDNFEQVIPAAAAVAELLHTTPLVKVLVTSRERLNLLGEYTVTVPALALPPILIQPESSPRLGTTLPLDHLRDFAAVQLFHERAVAVRQDFTLTSANTLLVAGICCRLDGVPLAIELAAARIHHLTPQEIYTRLVHTLPFLTGGARDLPVRQQTLRAAIAWSHALLTDDERCLFARLAVFRGGCTLAAAEAVCKQDLALAALDGLASLVDKSLVQWQEATTGEARFRLLELLREFAQE